MKATTPPTGKPATSPTSTPATPAASDTPSKGRSLPPVRHTPDVLPPGSDAPPVDPVGPPPPASPPSRPIATTLFVSDAPSDFERRLEEMRARAQRAPQPNTVRLAEAAPRPKARDEKDKEPSGLSLFVARIRYSVWTKVAIIGLIALVATFWAGHLSAPVTTVVNGSSGITAQDQLDLDSMSKTVGGISEAIKRLTDSQAGEIADLKKSLADAEAKLAEAKKVLEASQANEKEAIAAYDDLYNKWEKASEAAGQ